MYTATVLSLNALGQSEGSGGVRALGVPLGCLWGVTILLYLTEITPWGICLDAGQHLHLKCEPRGVYSHFSDTLSIPIGQP